MTGVQTCALPISTIDQMANQEQAQTQDLQDDTNHQENDQDPSNDNGGQDIGDSSPSTPLHSSVDHDQDEGDDEDVPPNERPEDALTRRITHQDSTLHQNSHYQKNIIGGLGRSVSTCGQLLNFCGIHSIVSHIEPVKVYDALEYEDWLKLCMKSSKNLSATRYGH